MCSPDKGSTYTTFGGVVDLERCELHKGYQKNYTVRKGRLYLTDDRHVCRRNHSGRHNRIYHRSRGVDASENYGVNDHRIHPLVKTCIHQNWDEIYKEVCNTYLSL